MIINQRHFLAANVMKTIRKGVVLIAVETIAILVVAACRSESVGADDDAAPGTDSNTASPVQSNSKLLTLNSEEIEKVLRAFQAPATIRDLLIDIKIVDDWTPESDKSILINEMYSFNSAELTYAFTGHPDFDKIDLGGNVRVGDRVDPRSFRVHWIRFHYRDGYITYRWEGGKYSILDRD